MPKQKGAKKAQNCKDDEKLYFIKPENLLLQFVCNVNKARFISAGIQVKIEKISESKTNISVESEKSKFLCVICS